MTGMKFTRVFSTADKPVEETVNWEKRSASITSPDGEVLFQQDNIDVPESWSQLATNIVASKYFYGENGYTLPLR